MKLQAIIPDEGGTNGLAPQPGPVVEVFCFHVDLGPTMLNEIFRKLPCLLKIVECPLHNVDQVG